MKTNATRILDSLKIAYELRDYEVDPDDLRAEKVAAAIGFRERVSVNDDLALMALAYVTFEIRRVYHGPIMSDGPTTGAEQYTYSIAWLAFGVALLGIGIVFNSQRARLASAAVIGLTILKAFLIDMSTLTGVYRALSFMCLGLVLVAIGWLYQRILFRRQTPPAVPAVQPGT